MNYSKKTLKLSVFIKYNLNQWSVSMNKSGHPIMCKNQPCCLHVGIALDM